MSIAVSRGSNRVANVISEVGGPAPLLALGILEVGISEQALFPTIVALFTLAIVPYLGTILLSRAGRVSDRFVGNRRQRLPILVGTLLIVLAGLVTLLLIRSPAALILISVTAVVALLIVTGITLIWKISIHATIAMFFAGLQIALYGPVGIIALLIPLAVSWARYAERAHTIAQLFAGNALGVLLVIAYAIATRALS
ncbi:hypothetical protein [Microbacterium sp. NPDC055665]